MNNQISPRAFAQEFAASTVTDSMIRIAGSFTGGLALATMFAALFAR